MKLSLRWSGGFGRIRRGLVAWVVTLAASGVIEVGLAAVDRSAKETAASGAEVVWSTGGLTVRVNPTTGGYRILDPRGGVTWRSHPRVDRFGQVALMEAGQKQTFPLGACAVRVQRKGLQLEFRPVPSRASARLTVTLTAVEDGRTLEVAYQASADLEVESVRLLDRAFWVTDREAGGVLVPVREGLLLPADSRRTYTRGFDTYAYEGCHLAMLGVVKGEAALLVSWSDPDVLAEVQSYLEPGLPEGALQVVAPSVVLRQSARGCRVQFLGRGDYVTVAKAYRKEATRAGWYVPWARKLAEQPVREKLIGAVNFKLWSVLDRRMNEASTAEELVRVNWTFDEAAQVAEHLRRDLQLERVLFLMGGWIHRGYDNQHPDILPAAPECGGNEGLADCARRVMAQGYLFGLHDNYQDLYRDAPSWDEGLLAKTRDGQVASGGHWAGGRAYLTCARKALELAQRPQNLPAVRQLTGANAYFIDTTYAAGLVECFDPQHPLTRQDDLHWKQALSDYARGLFGVFGSECGREWGLPHSDFFEGLTGVSGRAYHDAKLLETTGGVVVPLFELVYRECIAAYGKYGYEPEQAADYVLHHLTLGRPLHYHAVPAHLYWKEVPTEPPALGIKPLTPEIERVGLRTVRISYPWQVDQAPGRDWQVFVHFTDADGTVWFQNDHAPQTPTSQWLPGGMESRHFRLELPEGLRGTLDIRMGLWDPESGRRARLSGTEDGTRRYVAGRLRVTDRAMEILAPVVRGPSRGPNPGAFVQAHQGWAEGLHPLDRFLKNTYEVLSPLNELTARREMNEHGFLTPDRSVVRSVFGRGRSAVEVVVNHGPRPYAHATGLGGEVWLPPQGFVVTAPTFIAFHAFSWRGLQYDAPVLFTLRSLDGRPLGRSESVRVFHGFGDRRLRGRTTTLEIEKETVTANLNR